MLYLDAGAAVPNALAYRATMEHLGYHFVYQKAIGVDEINYTRYAADLKSNQVTLVQFEGSYQFAVRLKQAMQAQGVNAVFIMDSVAYDPVFVQAGGSYVDGMYSYVDTALFEEAAKNPELQLYTAWLHRVAPTAQPSFFGMFAWGAMALFTQLAVQLGGRLTRATLLAAIRRGARLHRRRPVRAAGRRRQELARVPGRHPTRGRRVGPPVALPVLLQRRLPHGVVTTLEADRAV